MEAGTTIFTTVISGVTVFVLGQIFLKLVIEPVQNLKATISKVAHCLNNDYIVFMNADVLSKKETQETYKKLRNLGAQLYADLHGVPLFQFFHYIFGLPSFNNVVEASDKLFGISIKMYSKQAARYDYMDLYYLQICKNLRIHVSEKMQIPESELKEAIKQLRGL